MLRLAGTLTLVFLLTGLVAWLAAQPGELVAFWRGYRIETSAATAIVLGALVLALAVLIPVLILRLARAPARFRSARAEHGRDKGYAALSEGLVAVAAGETKEARRHARTAQARLGDSPLVLLLSAQAAQLEDDNAEAERAFRAMLDKPETEFLGLRGLIVQALRRGDRSAAQPFLDRARLLRPRSRWILASQFDLACGAGDWFRAEALLEEMADARLLDDETVRRRRLVLWTMRGQDAERTGNLQEARQYAERANRLDPSFTPAALVRARCLNGEGDTKKAAKILSAAWKQFPHPALIRFYWDLVPGETPAQRLERTRRLIEGAPDARESRLAIADQAIAASALPEARAALDAVVAYATIRVCTLSALLAQAEQDEAGARNWLLRAAHAPRDPLWLCETCSSESPDWKPVCPTCGGFDTMTWTAPRYVAPSRLPGPSNAVSALPALETIPAVRPGGTESISPGASTGERAVASLDGSAGTPYRAPDDPGPDGDPEWEMTAPRAVHPGRDAV